MQAPHEPEEERKKELLTTLIKVISGNPESPSLAQVLNVLRGDEVYAYIKELREPDAFAALVRAACKDEAQRSKDERRQVQELHLVVYCAALWVRCYGKTKTAEAKGKITGSERKPADPQNSSLNESHLSRMGPAYFEDIHPDVVNLAYERLFSDKAVTLELADLVSPKQESVLLFQIVTAMKADASDLVRKWKRKGRTIDADSLETEEIKKLDEAWALAWQNQWQNEVLTPDRREALIRNLRALPASDGKKWLILSIIGYRKLTLKTLAAILEKPPFKVVQEVASIKAILREKLQAQGITAVWPLHLALTPHEETIRSWFAERPDLAVQDICERLLREHSINVIPAQVADQLQKWGISFEWFSPRH